MSTAPLGASRLVYHKYSPSRGDHFVTAGKYEGAGYRLVDAFAVHEEPSGHSVPLHRCYDQGSDDHFVSVDAGCEGRRVEGLLGYALATAEPGWAPLWRCFHPGHRDHMVARDPAVCTHHGYVPEGSLGRVKWRDADVVEVVSDPSFEQGFQITPWTSRLEPYESDLPAMLQPGWSSGSPSWLLAQWHSRRSLRGDGRETAPGVWTWANELKRVGIGRPWSSASGLTLAVNADTDYQHRYRRAGEPWVHLLVEQHFDHRPPLSELRALDFHLEARVEYAREVVEPGYEESLHTGQFLVHFVVHYASPSGTEDSAIWFGVPLYEHRPGTLDERFIEVDTAGSDALIWRLSAPEVGATTAHDGNWFSIGVDLLPKIQEAIESPRSPFPSQDLRRFHVSNMNLGWEVPGRFIGVGSVRGLSVRAAVLP